MSKRIWAIIGVVVVIVAAGFAVMMLMASPKANTAKEANVPAVNNAVLMTKTSSSLGQFLTDPSGKALYIYAGDSKGVSHCTGTCLATWPAYIVSGSVTNLPTGVGITTRSDNGSMQYTYNGMPLYYFISDTPGQVTGNGVSGFKLAKPVASPITSATSSKPASTSTPVAAAAQPASTPVPKTVSYTNVAPSPQAAAAPAPTPTSASSGGW